MSISGRTPRRLSKITLIAAGSALAVAGAFAGQHAAAPAQVPVAANSAVAGPGLAAAGLADPGHQLKSIEAGRSAAQMITAQRAAAARARAAATARAAKAGAAHATAARGAAAARAAAARAAAARAAAARAAARAAAARQAAQDTTTATSAPRATQPAGDPQQIAESMLGPFGWSSSQFSCLQPLWNAESGWNVSASNPSSGAYGIPQALPGSKMASAGPDWQTDAATQIRWGLQYIQSRYGSPCGAWSHEEAYGWY